MKKSQAKDILVTILGSAGIIALGYFGVIAWFFVWVMALCGGEGSYCKYSSTFYPVTYLIIFLDFIFLVTYLTKRFEKKK